MGEAVGEHAADAIDVDDRLAGPLLHGRRVLLHRSPERRHQTGWGRTASPARLHCTPAALQTLEGAPGTDGDGFRFRPGATVVVDLSYGTGSDPVVRMEWKWTDHGFMIGSAGRGTDDAGLTAPPVSGGLNAEAGVLFF